LVDLQVSASNREINTYSADGLIIATPTGSTAYNLSAQGPLLHPHMDAIILSAISPHSLSDRGLILSASTELTISWTPGQVIIARDGRIIDISPETHTLTVARARQTLTILHFGDFCFFDLLRNKLNSRGSMR
jgi:NAD+ kinase